jgi:hypothetical protein
LGMEGGSTMGYDIGSKVEGSRGWYLRHLV